MKFSLDNGCKLTLEIKAPHFTLCKNCLFMGKGQRSRWNAIRSLDYSLHGCNMWSKLGEVYVAAKGGLSHYCTAQHCFLARKPSLKTVLVLHVQEKKALIFLEKGQSLWMLTLWEMLQTPTNLNMWSYMNSQSVYCHLNSILQVLEKVQAQECLCSLLKRNKSTSVSSAGREAQSGAAPGGHEVGQSPTGH